MTKTRLFISLLMMGILAIQLQPKSASALVGLGVGTYEGYHGTQNQQNTIGTAGYVVAGVGALMTGVMVPLISCVALTALTVIGCAMMGSADWAQIWIGPFAHAGLAVNLVGAVMLDSPTDGFTYRVLTSEESKALGFTAAESLAYNQEIDEINMVNSDFAGRLTQAHNDGKSLQDVQEYAKDLWITEGTSALSPDAFSAFQKVSKANITALGL